jgi:hypothetical protein
MALPRSSAIREDGLMYRADQNPRSVSPDEVSIPVAEDGGVACPLVGHVTLDRCRECDYLRALNEDDAGRTRVRCATAPLVGAWMMG